jgi:SOS response regulatory protein OraA/RecX
MHTERPERMRSPHRASARCARAAPSTLDQSDARRAEHTLVESLVVAEINQCLDVRQRAQHRFAPATVQATEIAAQLAQRLAPLRRGFGVHEVGQALDSSEIQIGR